MRLTLETAKKILLKSEEKAKSLNLSVSIAIVDNYGILLAFIRMEDALTISPKFAIAKAYTSATLGMKTEDIASYAEPGKPYYSLNTMFQGELTVIAGGVPIIIKEKLVGGIGVGGAIDVRQDVICAEAGLEAIKEINCLQ